LNSQCLIQHTNGTSTFYGVRLNNYFLSSSCSNHKMYFGTLNDIKVFVENIGGSEQRILELRKKLGAKLIMGCDSHYVMADQGQARTDFLFSKGLEYPDEEGWFLDYPDGDTAYERFANQCVLSHEEILEAMNNTNIFLEVEEYDSPIFNDDIKLPSLYPTWTQAEKNKEYERLVWEGWREYRKSVPQERWPEYEEEIQKEMQVVIDTFMADYFIIDHAVMKRGISSRILPS